MKKIIYSFYVLFAVIIIAACNTKQEPSESINSDITSSETDVTNNSPEAVVNEILALCKEKNFETLNNKYVHTEFQVISILPQGAFNRYELINYLNEANIPSLNDENITFTIENSTVEYDCENMKWAKNGLFLSQTNNMANYMETLYSIEEEQNFEAAIPKNVQSNYIDLFNKSKTYKVVYTPADIVFYVSLIDNKYYITLIDDVSGYCGC